ncbi:SDR family oxidoreductase [Kineococcus sp. TBRC 1896]|uniref:SDR family oxidoreductase n=1 Tax=Kineococcus mangrovi TaxID=1660183 RepID=A0ABV4HXY7_9ACTN
MQAPPSKRGVAVVTGGSAGLGRAVVRVLADSGWDVAVLARGHDGLAGAVRDVAAAGRRAVGIVCDVSEHEQVEAAADRVEDVLGPVEVWVNDAMTSVFAPFLDTAPEDFERATRVTYLGFVNGTRAALRRMVPRDRGQVVQIGSALAFRGIPLQAAYCGSKHAMVGFTESVITELLHRGSSVHVSMVHMPGMNTTQFGWVRTTLPKHPQPVAPIYQPEACAAVVGSVVDHPRRNTWVGESTVGTILGNRTIAPLLDRYLARTGVSGQQTGQDASTMVGENLWEPVPGDHGAHGEFDDRSWGTSPQIFALRNRRVLTGVAAGAAALAVGLLARGARR